LAIISRNANSDETVAQFYRKHPEFKQASNFRMLQPTEIRSIDDPRRKGKKSLKPSSRCTNQDLTVLKSRKDDSFSTPQPARKKKKKRKKRKFPSILADFDPRTDFTVWTDGSCLKNPGGSGGWAFVVRKKDETIAEQSGFSAQTTNNRMEMMGIIQALNFLPCQSRILVRTDSQLVVRCFKGNWKRHSNLDLWQQINMAAGRHKAVAMEWVRGHDGHKYNERADSLAGIAATKSIELDKPQKKY